MPPNSQHHTLKYSLLGPSLTKSGQDGVDQKKVSEVIYNASKGSKFFNNEEARDKTLTVKISRILAKKRELQRIEEQGGLRSELKKADDYIAELEYERDLSQVVVHIDCDAFYAAVEELDQPELKELPFAVGMGVLTTCNYVARKFGCRSGMAGFVAQKLCPELIRLPLNFEKYTAKAHEVRAVLEQYDPRFESASIDEAYLNITQYCQDRNMDPEDAVAQMRAQVYEECKVTISAGIASNAKLAKICSNKNKPNGQFRLPANRATILAFMRELPTRKVNGVGRVFERELDAIGIKTCGEIYPQRHYLQRVFGEKAFQFLMGVYLGLGRTDIRPAEEFERKSVGTESTFHDMSDPKELRDKLRWTAEELERDLQRTQFKGRTLVLKIKLHTYEVFSRQVQPPKAVHTADDLYHFSLPMFAKLEKEIPAMKLRLMGLRCTHLVSMKKGDVDFFGRVRQKPAAARRKDSTDTAEDVNVDSDGWQVWPDAEFEDAARQERLDDAAELEHLSQEIDDGKKDVDVSSYNPDGAPSDYRRYGNGFAWRSILEAERAKAEEEEEQSKPAIEQWICPICAVPQAADERAFNEHIDGCLSRQTIKEIVQTTNDEPSEALSKKSLGPMPANTAKRKRGRPPREGNGDKASVTEGGKRARRAFFA
jgi:DNA polymerase kappa